jgi:ABC-type dipeptide/oligopeptide/nickel transport system ATPase component
VSAIPEGVSPIGQPAASGGVSIRDLTLSIGRGDKAKRILRGISLDIPAGQITGLAGESGSGKTMTGGLMRHTITPTANFQPMNSNFGVLEPLGERVKGKRNRYERLAERAVAEMEQTVKTYEL